MIIKKRKNRKKTGKKFKFYEVDSHSHGTGVVLLYDFYWKVSIKHHQVHCEKCTNLDELVLMVGGIILSYEKLQLQGYGIYFTAKRMEK